MAAELVGTAYVRIRAITAGLASEIKDGVEKGVKDVDVDDAGKALGGSLGEGATGSFKESMADGVTESFDSPEMHKASEEGGEGVAKDVAKGVDKENKRKNPFASMLDALKGLNFKGAFDDIDMPSIDTPDMHKDAKEGGERVSDSFGDGVDEGSKKRNPFKKLFDGIKKWMPKITLEFDKGGEDAGTAFGDGAERGRKKHEGTFKKFGESLSALAPKPVNWIAIFGPTTLAPIIGSVLSMVGLVVQALGFVATAAVGAAGAVAGIAAVALPGMAALFAAFKVQTKQLEKFKKRAKELLKPWEQFGIATQEFLLPGLENFLEAIQHLIPLFVEFGGRIGRIFGDMATFAGAIFTSEKNMSALGRILEASETFFTNIRTAVLKLADLLLPFLAEMAPLAVQFSESIAKWATGLHDTLSQEGAIESVGDKFQVWYDRFVLLVGIIGDVFAGLWGILEIAGTTGTPFFEKIAEAAQKFRDWVGSAEGQNKIKDFFDHIQPVLDEVWRLIGNLFDLIVKPAAGDGGATMLDRLATALGYVNTALEHPMAAKIVPLILGIATGLSVLSFMGKGVTAIETIATNIGKLGSAIGGVANVVRGFAGFGPLAATLAPLAPVLLAIAAAIAIFVAAWIFWPQIEGFIISAWEWFTKLNTPLKILVGTLAAFAFLLTGPVGLGIAAVLGIVAIFKHFEAVKEWVGDAWNAVWDFFTRLPEIIPEAWQAIQDFFTKLPEYLAALPGLLAAVGEQIVEFFRGLPARINEFLASELGQQIIGAITTVAESVSTALTEIGESIVTFFQDLPEKLEPILNEIVGFFEELPGKLKEALLTGLEELPGLILDALGGLGSLGLTILGWLADGLVAAAPVIAEWFIRLPFMIIDWVWTAASSLIELGLKLLMWIIDGLASALPELATWFLKLPFEILTLVRKGIWALLKLGVEMIVAIVKGVFKERNRILDFFHDLPLTILRMLAATIEFLFNLGKGWVTGILRGLRNVLPQVISFFRELPGKILRFLSGAGGFLVHIGAKLMNGLWEGINEVWDSIDEFFGELPGKIGGFFKRLPGVVVGALTDFVDTVIGFFVDLVDQLVGHSIIPDLIWDIVEWFAKLPLEIVGALFDLATKVIGIFWDLGVQLVAALPAVFQTLFDWFTALPLLIFDLFMLGIQTILDIGGKIVTGILDGIVALAQTLWDWFSGLPLLIWDLFILGLQTYLDIGGWIIGKIVDGLVALAQTLWDWFTALPGALLELLTGVSQLILDIGGAILGWIVDGIVAVWHLVTDWIATFPALFLAGFEIVKDAILDVGGAILEWVVDGLVAAWHWVSDYITEFPANFLAGFEIVKNEILDIGGKVLEWIKDGLVAGWHWVSDYITEFPGNFMDGLSIIKDEVLDIGGSIVSWIIEGLAGLADALWEAIKDALPSPGDIKDAIVGVAGDIGGAITSGFGLFGAEGGVFNQATPMIIGEAGTEALIPVTRPARALQLMQQSGLDKMVLDAYLGSAGGVGSVPGKQMLGDTTMLHIDNAVMTAPVDADMIVQKITSAYNRLAS